MPTGWCGYTRFRRVRPLCVDGGLTDTTTETAREHADAVEFRLDLADGPVAALDGYPSDELPLLVTDRPTWEGGAFEGDEETRLDALVEAAAHDAVAAVDLELETLRAEQGRETADAVRAHDAAVVASVHGSRIGYATGDPAAATVPGQYGLVTLRGLVDGLGERA